LVYHPRGGRFRYDGDAPRRIEFHFHRQRHGEKYMRLMFPSGDVWIRSADVPDLLKCRKGNPMAADGWIVPADRVPPLEELCCPGSQEGAL
jgi:hypothetical protein